MFKIYEFVDTRTVAVICINWVNNNQVKWHDKFAPKFIKKGYFPKNKWKSYNVKPLTSVTFEKYEEAELALKKVIHLDKTDIETDDVFTDHETQKIHDTSSSDDSEEDQYVNNNNPLKKIKPLMDKEKTSSLASLIVGQEGEVIPVTSSSQQPVLNPGTSSLAQENQEILMLPLNDSAVNTPIITGEYNISEGFNNEQFVLVKQSTLDQILSKVEAIDKSIVELNKTLKTFTTNINNGNNVTAGPLVNNNYRCANYLPLKNIAALDEFENVLKEENMVSDFKKFLCNTVSIKDIRSFTKLIINKTYTLELQAQVNYSGVKGKKKLQYLTSTEAIVAAICDSVPELVLLQDQNEKVRKAEAELKYQLQHFYDRKRSFDRQIVKRQQ